MSKPNSLMSQDTFEKYGGHCCPVCRSNNVEVEPGTLTADGDLAWDDVECNDCGSTWREFFHGTEYGSLDISDKLKNEPCAHCGKAFAKHDEEGLCPEPRTEEDDG